MTNAVLDPFLSVFTGFFGSRSTHEWIDLEVKLTDSLKNKLNLN